MEARIGDLQIDDALGLPHVALIDALGGVVFDDGDGGRGFLLEFFLGKGDDRLLWGVFGDEAILGHAERRITLILVLVFL